MYLHQVIGKLNNGGIVRYKDLPDAIYDFDSDLNDYSEWRVHFHIPLHASPGGIFDDTRDHIIDTLKVLAAEPQICQHIEMETYTWEVLPEAMQSNNVVDQLSLEYEWTLNSLRDVGLF